jgi:uncharacterized protein
MKIVIAGGSGQVGTILTRAFAAESHEIVLLSRGCDSQPGRVVSWDGKTAGPWCRELDGADAVINLAGRSVNCRYHAANRRDIMRSRIDSTRAIGAAIAACTRPPAVWLQASTATIYAHRFDAPNDDVTGTIGGHEPEAPSVWKFSIDVATAWEQAANDFANLPTRLVLMRSAMTMSPDAGGIFDTLLRLVRFGLGGTCGDGRQFVSWIHELDFVRAVRWLIDRQDLAGPVNLAAPNPMPNAEFMRELRVAWGLRVGLPAPKALLEIGAVAIRTESELILKSRRVVPRRLTESGFVFSYPDWQRAAADLCSRWRAMHCPRLAAS